MSSYVLSAVSPNPPIFICLFHPCSFVLHGHLRPDKSTLPFSMVIQLFSILAKWIVVNTWMYFILFSVGKWQHEQQGSSLLLLLPSFLLWFSPAGIPAPHRCSLMPYSTLPIKWDEWENWKQSRTRVQFLAITKHWYAINAVLSETRTILKIFSDLYHRS